MNDTHGHLVADAVLKGVGATLSARGRRAEIAARYGGEEFAVVLHARGDAPEDLRRAVAALSFEGVEGSSGSP